jgi:hypothetical protein
METHKVIELVNDEKKLSEYLDAHPWGLDYLLADLEKMEEEEPDRSDGMA